MTNRVDVGRAALVAAVGVGCSACVGTPDTPRNPEAGPPGAPAVEESPSAAPQEASAMTARNLRLTLSVAEGPAEAGVPIELVLEARNEGDGTLTLQFPDGQRFDFEIHDADGTLVWRWAEEMMFPQVLGSETIRAGEARSWSARLEAGLEAGRYRVVGTLTTMEPRTVELDLIIPG